MEVMDNNFKNYNSRKLPKGENFRHYNQVGARPRSQNCRRPFFGNGQQQSVPSWEKQFCAIVGSVPWPKVVETKKYMYQDEKVLQWKDSAVEEVFWNAKKRFWAEMNGRPCDIKLPDPDMFIDKINWDSNVDRELISDLEKLEPEDIPCETEGSDGGIVMGIPVVPEQYCLTPTGWGDAEEPGSQQKYSEGNDVDAYDRRESSRELEGSYTFVSRSKAGEGRDNKQRDHDHGGCDMSRYKISRFDCHKGNYRSSVGYGSKRVNFGDEVEGTKIKWRPVKR